MSYTIFKRMVMCAVTKDDKNAEPVFYHEDGKHHARWGGIHFTGCVGSKRVYAEFGSGHLAAVPEGACYNG